MDGSVCGTRRPRPRRATSRHCELRKIACRPPPRLPGVAIGECHREMDLGPRKIPDGPALRTSILSQLGEESNLGQHNVVHAQVTIEVV